MNLTKQISSLICIICICFHLVGCSEITDDKGILEGQKSIDMNVSEQQTVYIEMIRLDSSNLKLFLLQAALEGFGFGVTWSDNSEYAYFRFLETDYVCKISAKTQKLSGLEIRDILICEIDYIDSIYDEDHIALNPMASNGVSVIVEDRIYLGINTAERLFEALGCTVEFNQDRTAMTISY